MSFEREYFDGGAYDLYLDFPVHWTTVHHILKKDPKSVLDVGGARGYIVKHIEESGIRGCCMDISRWCEANRATKDFVLWDARVTPWPFKDNEFDLLFSQSFFEHIEEKYVDDIVREMIRVSNRGFHGITFEIPPDDIDPTHINMHPIEWWVDKFKRADPTYDVDIQDKEDIEQGNYYQYLPGPKHDSVKLNLGSFLDQFWYGWTNVDILNLHRAATHLGTNFMQYDISLRVREDDDSVECVIMSHVLEHLKRKQGEYTLTGVYRVLKPGGVLRIATPDLKLATQKYLNGTVSDFGVFDNNIAESTDDALSFWYAALAGHKTVYDLYSLTKILEKTGFVDIQESRFNESRSAIIRDETYDLHPAISIYVECSKPR